MLSSFAGTHDPSRAPGSSAGDAPSAGHRCCHPGIMLPMDSGLAAILGAATGSIGGVIGAITAGKAQRESVRMTLRSEQIKERRQPRHAVYKAFIQVTTDLKERLAVLEEYDHARREELESLRKEVSARWTELSLSGPGSVIPGASHVRDLALAVLNEMGVAAHAEFRLLRVEEEGEQYEIARERYENAMSRLLDAAHLLSDAIDDFAIIASAALDSDGTEPERHTPSRRRRLFGTAKSWKAALQNPDRAP